MYIERQIFNQPDLDYIYANIQIMISPQKESPQWYILYVQTLSLNDGVFHMKIRQVQRKHLEKACMLILNTLHMYYMPMYISKDVISQDDDDIYDYSPFAFNNAIELLYKPNGYDDDASSGPKWFHGEIDVNADDTLSFQWERKNIPRHLYDDGNEIDRKQYDLDFEESKKDMKNTKNTNDAPPGFKYACL